MPASTDEIPASRRISGIRTWRLLIAFFGGLAPALLITDYLATGLGPASPESAVSTPVRASLSLFAWPIGHLSAVTILAYLPLVIAAISKPPHAARKAVGTARSKHTLRLAIVLLTVLAYVASVLVSLHARHS